jgi:hypothetical protein
MSSSRIRAFSTVFIYAVANTYTTYALRTHLAIDVPPGTETEVKGALPVIKTSWGIQIDVGDIQFGQSRIRCRYPRVSCQYLRHGDLPTLRLCRGHQSTGC